MYCGERIAVVLPALDEAPALPIVLRSIPAWVDDVIVADNGSTDGTPAIAAAHGARVVVEPRRGYGAACQAGLRAAAGADVIVFLDADAADRPERMERLVAPVAGGEFDLVIGSRVLGGAEPGALTLPQRAGNRLAAALLRRWFGTSATDLGPFRCIRAEALDALGMRDRGFGWTVEMQARAARAGLRVLEVPVEVRRRVGRSKISGTARGVIGAGTKILYTLLRERFRPRPLGSVGPRQRHLILFCRAAVPGAAKTRLIPALGAAGAADLHQAMARRTLAMVERAAENCGASVEVRFSGGDRSSLARDLGARPLLRRQPEGDLGRRLERSADLAFARGAEAVVVAGTDCPELQPHHLAALFLALTHADAAIIPARDGGYVAIGLARPAPALFANVSWGTSAVLEQTLARARAARLEVELLEPLADVDEPGDLAVLDAAASHRSWPRVSVVIPALDEEAWIERAIASAAPSDTVEVIVADGGSTDRTVERARRAGARVIAAPPGRAPQLNAGAAAARGALLVFLHADTTLPAGSAERLSRALEGGGAVLAAFSLAIDDPRLPFRLIEAAANLRSRRLKLPFGDQVLALRAATFNQLGGFFGLAPGEDLDLVRRAGRLGRVVTLPERVRTSARRWSRQGILKTTLEHQRYLLRRLLRMRSSRQLQAPGPAPGGLKSAGPAGRGRGGP